MYSFQCSVFIVLLVSLTYAMKCGRDHGCDDCDKLPGRPYEIGSSGNTSQPKFRINYVPSVALCVSCHNSSNLSEFHFGEKERIKNVDILMFSRCRLPEGGKLGAIARQIIAKDLAKLSLQSNKDLTSTLSREMFAEFRSLKGLELIGNQLKNVPADLIHDLTNLKVLNLSENDLSELPAGFLDVDNLENVFIMNNRLEVIKKTTFDKLNKLKVLDIRSNKLVEIEPQSFDKLEPLSYLNIQENNLHTLPEDIFAKLKYLRKIILSQNNFSADSLPETLLRNNTALRSFELSGNKQHLTTLPPKFFATLFDLTDVNIGRNELVYLPVDLFVGCPRLRNLNIEQNYIEELPQDIFQPCQDLLTLKLSNNRIRKLSDELLTPFIWLEDLDLSSNHITTINADMFKSLTSLKVLNMERNRLKTIHLHGLQQLLNLEIAKFAFNQLTLKPNGSEVDTHGGRPSSPFYACKKLEELDLANNDIFEIFGDWIEARNLGSLNLRNNSLQMLEAKDIFFVSKNLKVDLSFNHIERISLANVTELANNQSYSNGVTIFIENNPMSCDCEDLYNLLRCHEGLIPKVHLNMSNLICHKPSNYVNMSVESFKSSTLRCPVESPKIYNATCPPNCQCSLNPRKPVYLVDCSYKKFKEAPKSLKSPRGRSIELNLIGNSLTKMPLMKQDGYDSVTVLYLSKNKITEVPLDAISQKLQVLALDSNNLTRLEKEVLDVLNNSTELRHLSLQMNPWACDCGSQEFLSFIRQKIVDIPGLQRVHCTSSDKPMLQMTCEEMCPQTNTGIIVTCVLVALLGILIGIIGILYYRFQQKLKQLRI